MSITSMAELKSKLDGYKQRRSQLREEHARQEERLKSAKEKREEAETRLLELTGTKTVEGAEQQTAEIYARLQQGMNALDDKLTKAGIQ